MKGNGAGALDPILGPAAELEKMAIVSGREWGQELAGHMTNAVDVLIERAGQERHPEVIAQLIHVAEALGVCAVSMIAYSRGKVPKVSQRPPPSNVVVPH